MAKRTFQGQNDGAAPAQDYNQGVYDNPEHGVSHHTPAPSRGSKSITSNPADPRDAQSIPSRIQEGAVSNPRPQGKYMGHNEQLSQNDEGHSGLPHLSDGTPRHNSQASSPLATPSKTGPTKPVNAKKP